MNRYSATTIGQIFMARWSRKTRQTCPSPLGNPVQMSCFVDADHAGNKVTRRSHTGIFILLNNTPVIAFSKRQNTCESSTYGSELVAMRIAKDMISALRIKLKCFGIPLSGPTNVFCDNNGVVQNTSIPESTLSKKHNAINYHIIREAVACSSWNHSCGKRRHGDKHCRRIH